MNLRFGTVRVQAGLAMAAVLVAIALGFVLRLVDPLSTPVVPAEDPYTHMAIVREHLRTGDFEQLTAGAGLYPPGLHSFLAAVWVFTGTDLYEIIRLGPAVFGAIGILGMGLVLWRFVGPGAAVVGSLAYAVAPEVIFRTTMMSPTAQDLAVLPFFLYALLHVTAGRLAWAGVAAPTALFLVFAHPWLFAILALMGGTFVALTFLLPFHAAPRERVTLRGLAAAAAIVGGGLGLTLTSCGGVCGPGWVDIFPALAGQTWLAWLLFAVALAPLATLLVLRRRVAPDRPATARDHPRPLPMRIAISLAIALVLGWMTWMAARQGMPPHVNLPRMIGWPILGLAGFAVVMLPFLPGRVSHLGAGLVVATYPFVIFNPLDSPFWSHRTVAFLAVGLMLLAGVAAAAIARWIVAAVATYGRRSRTATGARSRRIAAVAAGLLVFSVCGGTVYAGTPDGYPGGWYRMYPECEMDGFRAVAGLADDSPEAIVIVGGWQSKLVLSAFTDNTDRIWFATVFYTEPQEREELVAHLANDGHPVIVVLDRYLMAEHPDSTGFVNESPWEPLGSWCSAQGTGEPRLLAYWARVPQ